ncbi:interferon regulatory factor 9 [Podarcis raffonei]|uniref:interferon regulatory factor 9 n=1 Tax=Podarcis raffonei TaxID=65483 RepID=UPI0023295818|nr:interferon regulatory factor 9 [Podarcis raffonei]XP_053218799.1 interferon regulatory factor 9 [Podarcis raffonei]
MATSRRGVRRTRKLRQWTVEQVESGQLPGVVWDDPPHKTMFRIPWKHAGKQEFRHEEDAGFFKAWAIFKGKYRPGEPLEPATWKTRIRCAFSKSPEFEEVPERSKLGTAEPYKVYRLVPPPEQGFGTQPKLRKPKAPRLESSNGSSEKENGDPDSSLPQPPAAVCSLKMESSSTFEAIASQAPNVFAALVVPNGEMEPESMESALAGNEIAAFNQKPEPDQAVPISENVRGSPGNFFVILSVSYGGKEVLKELLPEGEFLVTSAAAPLGTSGNSMLRVVLPPASSVEDAQKKADVCRLLKDLEKGVMAASNAEGIFVQCRGRASIFLRGPGGTQPHRKLPSNAFLQLFSTKSFKSALQEYYLGHGPKPQHQVTLCVGEELGQDCVDSKRIVIQMEQIFASAAVSPPVVQPAAPQVLLVVSEASAGKWDAPGAPEC